MASITEVSILQSLLGCGKKKSSEDVDDVKMAIESSDKK